MTKDDLRAEAGVFARAAWRTFRVVFAFAITLVSIAFVGAVLNDFFGNGGHLAHFASDLAMLATYLCTDDRASSGVLVVLMLVFATVYWRLKFHGAGFRSGF